MTYEEILSTLKANSSVSNFAHGDVDWKDLGLGSVEKIASHGGEDQGSDWWRVYYFQDHDIYIKASGYYSSYNGTDFEGWGDAVEQVKPTKREVTFYE